MRLKALGLAAVLAATVAAWAMAASSGAPPTISVKYDAATGQPTISWSYGPGQEGVDLYWSSDPASSTPSWASVPILACAQAQAGTCTGHRDLGAAVASSGLFGAAPGTYYVQLVVNEPTATSSYQPLWSNIIKVVVPAAKAPTKPATVKRGAIPPDNGTPACKSAIAKITYANSEIEKVLANLKFVNKLGNSSVQKTRQAQLQKRLKDLEAALAGYERAAAKACKK